MVVRAERAKEAAVCATSEGAEAKAREQLHIPLRVGGRHVSHRDEALDRHQQKRATAAQTDITATHPKASLEIVPLDLASLRSVREAAERILAEQDRVDLLVNNAGVMAIPERQTERRGRPSNDCALCSAGRCWPRRARSTRFWAAMSHKEAPSVLGPVERHRVKIWARTANAEFEKLAVRGRAAIVGSPG